MSNRPSSRTILFLLCLSAALGGTASAQSLDSATPLTPLEVTGSRIKGTDMQTQVPVYVLDREALERTGVESIGEVLQQLTAGGKALNAKFNSSGNFGFPADGGGIGAGSSQVDLRHLESKRVLVLVDGVRWVNEASASGIGGAVDLNTIPLAIVDRIEVLEDGASAIYGSDAIAGVVNIITRRSFKGRELSLYGGQYRQGDGRTLQGDLTWGGDFDRLHVLITGSYFDQQRVKSSDREISRFPVPGTGVTRGSSGTPQGRFIFCDRNRTPDCNPDTDFLDLALDNGTGTPVYDPNSPNAPPSTYHDFGLNDRFNFAPFNLLLTPSERYSVFGSTRLDLSDNLNWYVKALYNTRTSINQAAPEPIFIGGDAGTGGLADTISIPANHPFNPFGIDLIAGDNFSLIGRRPLEGGSRIFTQDVDTTYVASGFQGNFELWDRRYYWDLNGVTSNNEAKQVFLNGYNVRNLKLALGDPAVCAATPGCTPLNLFGGQGVNGSGTITSQMLDYVRIVTRDSSENSLSLASANLSGELFDLPAGSIAFATGLEFRNYKGRFDPDPVRTRGDSQDSRAIPAAGRYSVKEAYGELNIPILDETNLLRELDFSAALRYSDYSSFGSQITDKFGLRWQPFEDLVLRGTRSSGFRAPFIGELFGLAQFGAVLTDPCSNAVDDADGPDTTPLETNCRAQGVPSGYEQINPQITTNTGGNPNLKPETSDSYTVGLLYSPGWAEQLVWSERLDLSVTYYSHEIKNAIRAPDAQTRLNDCVNSGSAGSSACTGITRTANGQINRFDNLLANIGQFETSGWDFKLNWSAPAQTWGRIGAALQGTWVTNYRVRDDQGTLFPQREGVEVNDGAIPELQSNLQLSYAISKLSVGWTLRYIGAVLESCSDFRDDTALSLTNLGLCSQPNSISNSQSLNELPATIYNDVQLGWRMDTGFGELKLSAGINNVFDQDPPVCVSCSLNGYDAGTYEAPGQFGYLQAKMGF